MKKKIIFPLILLAIIVKSQDITGNYSFNQIANLKSPQTSDFTRYGNLPISKFVGLPSVEIPLFNLKSNQMGDQITVSLGYNFSGFVPNKRPDIVGLNWFLNTGGVITREVNSIPDDQKGQSNALGALDGMTKDGLIIGLRNKKDICPPLHNDTGIFNFTTATGAFGGEDDYRLNGCDIYTAYDPDPDVFSFNFNGYSGKFFIGNDNQIKIISDNANGLKIDITNIGVQPLLNDCKPIFSEIKITDDKGNEYFFGGETKNIEYTFSLGHIGDSSDEERSGLPIINSWFLKRIHYINGENIYFNYYDDSVLPDSFCKSMNYAHHPNPESKKFIIYNESLLESAHCDSFPDNTDPNAIYNCILAGETTGIVYSITKKAILESITGADFKLTFNYSDQPYIFNNNTYNQSVYKKLNNKQLNSIVLYDKNLSEINKFYFTYDLLGGTTAMGSFPRLFLKKIQEKSKSPYIFDYHISPGENLPKPSTKQIDHWGFYNGKSGNESSIGFNIPTHTFTPEGDYTFTSSVRDPDFNYSVKGVLEKITYPTKGTTFFQFEAPSYTKRLERKSQNGFMPTLYNVTGNAGGIRIKSIKDTDENNNSYERIFTYEDGILLNWPRYIMWVHNELQSRGWIRSSSINTNVMESSIINYGKVTETVIGKGKTISEFSNYLTHPDISDYNIKINYSNPLSASTNLPLAMNYIGLFYNDISNERGRLINEISYDNINRPVKKITYSYNDSPERFNFYSSIIHTSGPAAQANKKYYYQNKITKKETFDYLYDSASEKILKTTESYTYNNQPDFQVASQKTIFPESGISEVLYKYAYQKNNSYLLSKNIISIPLETEVRKNGETISKTEIIYPISEVDAKNRNIDNKDIPVPFDVFSKILGGSEMQKKITYNKYDGKGNLVQYTLNESGTPVTIIWGYNQTQPIAKIEGATYAQVSPHIADIVNASDADDSAAPGNNESSLLDLMYIFRKKSALSGYQITTYTYDPLIGIRSITPPSGITEYYFYDTGNRLEFIKSKDESGSLNIIKEYKYHYISTYYYNTVLSGTFTRNDCPFGTLPGNVLYTVPAGTYSSTISQEDADQKAQNDINANGQNYANTHGICTPYECEVASSTSGIVTVEASSFKEIALNHLRGILDLRIPEPGTTIWLHGVSAGILDELCRPSSLRTVHITDDIGANWTIKIFPDGNVSLKSTDNQAEIVTLTFEYDRN